MMSEKIVGYACPKCFKKMENLGNVSGFIQTSNPPMWTDVWVCHACKVKKNVCCRGEWIPEKVDISSYEEV